MIRFEWSPAKSRANAVKHGVSFDEAATIFYDEFARQFYDDEHSSEEDRYIMLGMSRQDRVLVVIHCERETGDVIRIISARKATRREREFYKGPVQ